MRLSDHFTLDEMTVSQTAARRGIDNDPTPAALAALTDTAQRLEAVRALLGGPISVSSGYRSPALNRAVGGAPSSAHLTGHAADFNCYGFGSPLQVCEAIATAGVAFDQLIHEYGRWTHISFDPRLRGQTLTIDRLGTRPGLHPVR